MSKARIITKQSFQFFLRIFIDLWDIFRKSKKVAPTGTGKRILIFNWRDTKHVYAGGAEVYIRELAKRWVKNGASVTIFCGSDGHSKRNEVVDGIQIIRRGGFYFVYFWAFLYYLVRFRGNYDIIIDCENGIPFFTPLYARKKTFLVIHHVHQEIFIKNLAFPLAQIASFMEAKLMPLVYRNIPIITVSPSSKREILRHKLTNIEPRIIYNGIDKTRYKPGEKDKTPFVLYVGRLQTYKSLHILIQAAKQVLYELPTAKFVIAGTGEDKDRLVRLTKKLGLEQKILFTGRITDDEKRKLMQKAWVFVNPSLREGWGITTIEANASGTPVIASDVSGLKDAILHKKTGYLLPYGDTDSFAQTILLVLKNKQLRERLSQAATLRAQKFSWDNSANAFATIMAEALYQPSVIKPMKRTRLTYILNKIHSLFL